MNVIQYMENDLFNKPLTRGYSVYVVDNQLSHVTREEFSVRKVFCEGLGQLHGKYKIRLNETHPRSHCSGIEAEA